ncbi:MAG TPA: hypothetical protein VFH47_00100 [Candidatus Thermoplasmatota archaeon]|nr:hypothetical protein [Candidatus Thermoplasmatota archaeon]
MPGQAPLDWWSLVHVCSGAMLGLAGVSGPWMLAILVGYEVLEAGLRRIPRRKDEARGLFEHESWANIAMDVVVGAAGWLVAKPFGPLGFLPWA